MSNLEIFYKDNLDKFNSNNETFNINNIFEGKYTNTNESVYNINETIRILYEIIN